MNIIDKIIYDPISKGLKFFSRGGQVTSQSPTGMSNELATQLGLKQYVSNNTSAGSYYNGLTPSLSGPSMSYWLVIAVPYQVNDGSWRIRLQVILTLSAISNTFTVTIAGVTFYSVGGALGGSPGYLTNGDGTPRYAIIKNSSGNIDLAGTSSRTEWGFGGDFALASKPTWAY